MVSQAARELQVGRCPQVQGRLQPYNLVLAHNEIQLLLDMIHQLIPSSRSRSQSVPVSCYLGVRVLVLVLVVVSWVSNVVN